MTGHDLYLLSPELAMVVLGSVVVILDLILNNKRVVSTVGLIGLLAPLGFSLSIWIANPAVSTGVFGALVTDKFALFFHFLLIGVTALVLLASFRYEEKFQGMRGEYVGLMLYSVTGMMLLASTRELISMYVALELTSLPLAALAAFLKTDRSTESGLKFLLLSALSSAILLYGLVFIYGFTGTTFVSQIFTRVSDMSSSGALQAGVPFGSWALLFGIVMAIIGFGFKLAAVPSQMWVPDVYEGSPTPVVAFLSVASKAAGFAVVLRLLYTAFDQSVISLDWSALFAILAAITMTAGNLMALNQRNLKRLLGYSTIAHAGYILVGLAAVSARTATGNPWAGPQGVLFYLMGYGFTNLATFFAIIAITNRTGDDMISGFAGMAKRAPRLAFFLAVGLVSLIGIPPTVGFMGKAFLFTAAVNSGFTWLAILGMVNSAVSAFYYLRVVRTMYLDEPPDTTPIRAEMPLRFATMLTAAGIGVFGVAPWFLLRFAELAVHGLTVG